MLMCAKLQGQQIDAYTNFSALQNTKELEEEDSSSTGFEELMNNPDSIALSALKKSGDHKFDQCCDD